MLSFAKLHKSRKVIPTIRSKNAVKFNAPISNLLESENFKILLSHFHLSSYE